MFKSVGKAANPYLDQIESQSMERMNPYTSLSSLGKPLQDRYGQMSQNPVGSIQDIRSQYEQSPGHKRAMYDAMMAADNAAASGGMVGTPMHQEQKMETAAGINDQYERQWVRDAMGQQRYGLEGQQGLFNQGMGANEYLNDNLGSSQYTRANLSMRDRQNNNNRRNGIIKFLMQAGGGGAGWLLGGPSGALAGSKLASAISGGGGDGSGANAVKSVYDYYYPTETTK